MISTWQNPWTRHKIASWCFISSLAGSISNQQTNVLAAGPSPLLWSSQALGKSLRDQGGSMLPGGFWYEFDGRNLENQQVQYPKKHNSWDIHFAGAGCWTMLNPSRVLVEPLYSYSMLLDFADEPFARFDHSQWPLLWKTVIFRVKIQIFLKGNHLNQISRDVSFPAHGWSRVGDYTTQLSGNDDKPI